MQRSLSVWDGTALLFGSIVGSGIFASPGSVLLHSGMSGQLALLVWTVAGFISYCGALCYLELAIKLPSAGGESHYLAHYFGKTGGFLFTWTTALVARPCSFAITTLVCARYLCRFWAGEGAGDGEHEGYCNGDVTLQLSLAVAVLVLLCTLSSKLITVTLKAASAASMLGLAVAMGIGLYFAWKHPAKVDITPLPALSEVSGTELTTAFLSALWSFDGWNTLNYASEEFAHPSRDLPLIVQRCMLGITAVFVFVNLAYLTVLDSQVVATSESIGVDLAKAAFGMWGERIMPLFVASSAFGASVGGLFSASRLVYSTGNELGGGELLTRLTWQLPVNALVCQFGLGVGFLFVGNFDQLVGVFSCATWVFYLATVSGLVRSRFRTDWDGKGDYVAPTYALVLFPITCLLLVLFQIAGQPKDSLLAFGFIALGVPFYRLRRVVWCQRYACCFAGTVVTSEEEEGGETERVTLPVKSPYQTF
ncbi:hypothetical protein BASA81_010037 [Batrachochytrium salamandrivorans]|nr:hypothetical protein BASA81_010037 [Batrachochytrium salamandrivorans]